VRARGTGVCDVQELLQKLTMPANASPAPGERNVVAPVDVSALRHGSK
jgi:hypothetical protein